MSDVTLTSAVRQNLLSLQSTTDLIGRTQNRLSTGLRVSNAIDDPVNFFQAKGLNDRASDFTEKKSGIDQGISTLTAATEFLFGPHLLVAPVLAKGQRQRELYLPREHWYRLDTGDHQTGPRRVTVNAPLSAIPVFVRAGAVIPTASVVQSTMQYAPEELGLDLYAPVATGTVTSMLHEDDGLTERHNTGEFVRTEFEVQRKRGRISLTARVTGAGFPRFRRQRFRVRVFGLGPRPREQVVENRGESFALEWSVPRKR